MSASMKNSTRMDLRTSAPDNGVHHAEGSEEQERAVQVHREPSRGRRRAVHPAGEGGKVCWRGGGVWLGRDGAGHRDEVPSGVPRPQAGRPLREWGGARHRHVHLPLLLHLLDEADHVQAQVAEAETYDDSLMWKETKGSYSCHCVTCCAVLYAINF